MGMDYLVETALLGQGLGTMANDYIGERFPSGARLAWVEAGRFRIAKIEEFLEFRSRDLKKARYDGDSIRRLGPNSNGYLTASATIYLAEEYGVPLVITAGLGGIGGSSPNRVCKDLDSIAKFKGLVVATAFKDMMNLRESLGWIYGQGAKIAGSKKALTNGYIFKGPEENLSFSLEGLKNLPRDLRLILNPIDEDMRIYPTSILREAEEKALGVFEAGGFYHPTINSFLDRKTGGRSSELQLGSLIANINLGQDLIDSDYIREP